MRTVEPLHRDSAFNTIRIQQDASNDSHWCFMHAQQAFADQGYRACFSPRLLRELRLFARQAIDEIGQQAEGNQSHLAHIVLASDTHVFNLGGDLGLFSQLIRNRDRDGLLHYARECVDSVHLLHTRLHPNAHTIGLVEGDALGGGFELALACIRQNRRIATARLALHRVRDAVAPLSLDELTRITEIWVDTAMQLSDKSLRVMERLVRAQLRRPDPSGEASAAIGSARSE